MFLTSTAVRVVSVALGPAALGVVVSWLSPPRGPRRLYLAGFPLVANARAGLYPGQRGWLYFTSLERPVELRIENRLIWAGSAGPHRIMTEYASPDRRRRKAWFAAYGLTDAETAIGVALTDPVGRPPGLQAQWRDVFAAGRRLQDDVLVWNWWPGYPPQGRRRSPLTL